MVGRVQEPLPRAVGRTGRRRLHVKGGVLRIARHVRGTLDPVVQLVSAVGRREERGVPDAVKTRIVVAADVAERAHPDVFAEIKAHWTLPAPLCCQVGKRLRVAVEDVGGGAVGSRIEYGPVRTHHHRHAVVEVRLVRPGAVDAPHARVFGDPRIRALPGEARMFGDGGHAVVAGDAHVQVVVRDAERIDRRIQPGALGRPGTVLVERALKAAGRAHEFRRQGPCDDGMEVREVRVGDLQ